MVWSRGSTTIVRVSNCIIKVLETDHCFFLSLPSLDLALPLRVPKILLSSRRRDRKDLWRYGREKHMAQCLLHGLT